MSFIKKIAWYGSPVALAAMMAVALLLAGPAEKAEAASSITGGTWTAPLQLAGLTETYTIAATATETVAAEGDLAAGDTLTVTFPAGFTPPSDGGTFTPTGAGWATCGGTTATAAQVVTITLTDSGGTCAVDTSAGGVIDFTLSGVKNDGAGTKAAAGFTLGITSVASPTDPAGVAASADVEIVGLTLSGAPTSIPADGASNTLISITPSAAAANTGGGLITLTTTNGKILTTPATTAGDLFSAAPNVSLDGLTASQSAVITYAGVTAATVTLQAPAASGSATVTVRATPAGGGSSVLMGQITITFTTATADPVLSSISVTPTTTVSVAAAGGAGNGAALTITLKDQFGATLISGTSVTVSTDGIGVIDSNATTCNLGANDTGAAANSDADCKFTSTGGADIIEVYGINVAGTTTVTIKATPAGSTTAISKTKTVTLTGGTVSTIELNLYQKTPTATVATAGSIIHNVTDTTGTDAGRDELLAVATMLDVNGNAITPAGVATFSITNSSGAAVGVLSGGGAVLPLAGTACDGTINSTLGTCTDTVEASAALTKAGATAVIDNDKTSTTPLASGEYTVTVSHGSGAAKRTATATFNVAGGVATITITGDANVGIGAAGSLTAEAVDADGNSIADGSNLTWSSSSAVLLTQTSAGAIGNVNPVTTTGGSSTITTLGLAQGTSELFATIVTVNGQFTVTIGEAVAPVEPPVTGTGGITSGTVVAGGVSLVVVSDGTSNDGLTAALNAQSGIDANTCSVNATVSGSFVTYVPGASIAAANANWNTTFPDGVSGALLVVC